MHDVLHALGRARELVLTEHVDLGIKGIVELLTALGEPLLHGVELDVGLRGQKERQDHSCKRGVHAGVEHADPQDDSQQHVPARMVDLRHVEQAERHADARRGGEPRDAWRLAVEERDHDDAQKVVGDGEGREEHLGGRRHLVAGERHDAERKGDVRGDGNGPALCGTAQVKDRVDERGRGHASAGGKDGHERVARVGEHAGRELELELDAHGEEEDRHKEVVDEALERDLAHKRANL